MSKLEFTHEENLKDSGLPANSRCMPITSGECEKASEKLDSYACMLLKFLLRRVKRLAKHNASLQQEVEITRKLNEALRQKDAQPIDTTEKLQAAILDRCNVALELEPLREALYASRPA